MTKTDSTPHRLTLAYGGIAFAVSAPVAYIAQRLYGRLRAPGLVNPAIILQSSHVEYYWRVAIATWFGVAVAILTAAWLARDRGAVHRGLSLAAAVSMALCATLAWLYP